MKAGFFTTGALDNLDHNLTSTTAHPSFHGKGISLTQHEFSGADAPTTSILNPSVMGKRAVSPLPAEYTNIPEVSLTKDEATSVPLYDENINITPTSHLLQEIVDVDTARLVLFDKTLSFESMPPSSDALFLHVLRAAYQVYNSCFTYLPVTYHSSLQRYVNIM